MRFTIERLRTLILAAGAVVIASLIGFLVSGRWKAHFRLNDIPKRLGVNIQQEANGFTRAEFRAGHAQYKITASKVEKLKNDYFRLHETKIELYGEDGSRVDSIEGHEFEYDQKNGIASAAGPVEITIMRPGEAPAVAPKATPEQAVADKVKGRALANMAQTIASGQIHVKTSGLIFDGKSRQASTKDRVEFATLQGSGSSIGAVFDSERGTLVLDHAVELNVRRNGETANIHAQHAEFQRDELICNMLSATARYKGGETTASQARILFRQDGTLVRLEAKNGFALTTPSGAKIAAPTGSLDFDEHNQPRHAQLEGGVTMASEQEASQVRGSAPSSILEFNERGELRHAHLERGVAMHIEQKAEARGNRPAELLARNWNSALADIDFRNSGKHQTELAAVHGAGGVVIAASTQRGSGPALPSRMTADEVTASFASDQQLSSVVGTGHAGLEQTTAAGARQSTNGDRVEARFAVPSGMPGQGKSKGNSGSKNQDEASGLGGIQSATVEGHVVLFNQPAAHRGDAPQPPLRATAGTAVYESAGEWFHLTASPRLESGGLQLAADKVDVSQATGDAFAHGDVKATWLDAGGARPGQAARTPQAPSGQPMAGLGAQGAVHVVASEAQLHSGTGEAVFRGQARLWQQANSVEAPVIVLDRNRKTLVARSTSASDPVRLVVLNSAGMANAPGGKKPRDGRPPSVIRVRAGDLKYSDAERKAMLHASPGGSVVAETAMATTSSSQVELVFAPQGNSAQKDGEAGQVDHLVAKGHVSVTSQGRRGTGEQLVYSGETGDYELTGTAASLPRMTDSVHGVITGEALIFNGHDDSVRIEGEGRKTTAETRAPR